mmetsp:Transcript_172148/g.551803  ORF Transcript_172148/g.551803 Transcript_172148/m.551803 type:complete len:789 (+) Transcript_172148:72-2438(+)
MPSYDSEGDPSVMSEVVAVLNRAGSVSSKATLNSQDQWWESRTRDHCCSAWVMYEASWVRAFWNLIVGVLLVYTGTIFLFRICFIDFHIPTPIESGPGWQLFDEIVNVAFWLDLVSNFFFTYRDKRGLEVDSIRLIAKHYLKGYFWVNLFACTPEVLVQSVMEPMLDVGVSCGACTAALRISRLQRMSKLARLVRIMRLSRFSNLKLPKWAEHFRGVRIMNNAMGLIWVVHLLACGWYLCAAFTSNPESSWVGRRSLIDESGNDVTLLASSAIDQWSQAFYFILTVFTTVGFGDMAAQTTGEIVYVCFTMLVGAVVHSIVISEVIGVVTSVDKTQELANKQALLVEAFAEHTGLDKTSEQLMTTWVTLSARGWAASQFDREEMKTLINDKGIPRSLLGRLPANLFGGRLVSSSFLRCGPSELPPRLPLLLALSVTGLDVEAGELVYQKHDLATNVFLVLRGTFADIARPSNRGGIDEPSIIQLPGHAHVISMCSPKSGHSSKVKTSPTMMVPGFIGMPTRKRMISGREVGESDRQEQRRPSTTHLYPYKLYSKDSYFGLNEVFNTDGRYSTVRCESDGGGSLLLLPKADLFRLVKEFPQFGKAWASQSLRREHFRHILRGDLKKGMTWRRLAATRIQREFRAFLARYWTNQSNNRDEVALRPCVDGASRVVFSEVSQDSVVVQEAFRPAPLTSGPAHGANLPAPKPAELRQLAAATEANTREVRDLRAGMDAMRSEIASFKQEMLAALSGGRQSQVESPRRKNSAGQPVAVQETAYTAGEAPEARCWR